MIAHRDLLRALIELRLRSRAKRSVVGTFWPMVSPFFLLGLWVFVFQRVYSSPIPRYVEYLFAGLLPWTFVTQSLNQSLTSLSQNANLIRRGPFPRELLPISSVLVIGVYFLATLVFWIGVLAVRGHVVSWAVLPILIVPIVALFTLVSAISMVLSVFDVRHRDLRFVIGNLLMVWFFLLPIVYRPSMAPGFVQALRSIDPMNMIVGQFRDILHFGGVSRPGHMALMVVVTTLSFLLSLSVFRHTTRDVAKDV